MKLTDVHTTLHLTQTVLQLTFSLHSVSVSYLCYIHNRHYDFCHCGPPKPNHWSTNCWWPHSTPPIHLVASWNVPWNVPWNNGLRRHSGVCVTIYGVAQWLWFLGSRNQRKELAAGAFSHAGGVDVCWTACLTAMSDHATFLNCVIASRMDE